MKFIIPMAGRGSRLRPHSLTVPKPLIPVAGKPIVQRLVEDLKASIGEEVDEIAFIIGDFGTEVENNLIAIAEGLGAKGTIYHQDQPLGTAHAILCAEPSLTGPVLVAFADTLFQANFKIDKSKDGVIWAKKVEDPSAYGVLKLDNEGVITDFVEKPETFVSDLAIVGIYYFQDGDNLKSELQYLLDNDIKEKGEFQLTNAMENMKAKGKKFVPGQIDIWLDCGNKEAVVYSNQEYLGFIKDQKIVDDSLVNKNSIVIPPCYISQGVQLENSVVGPFVSIGPNTIIKNSIVKNTVIQSDTQIMDANIQDSMIGSKVIYKGSPSNVSIGDFSQIK